MTDSQDDYPVLVHSPLSARILKHGETFAVLDRLGDIGATRGNASEGLFHEGTRFVSVLRLRLSGARPLLLSSTVHADNTVFAIDLMNPDLQDRDDTPIPHGVLHILRRMFLTEGACYGCIQLSSFEPRARSVRVELQIAADFADVFEVRGSRRQARGKLEPPQLGRDELVLSYVGLDGVRRRTRARFAPAPTLITPDRVVFELGVGGRKPEEVFVTVSCETGGAAHPVLGYDAAQAATYAAFERAQHEQCEIVTSNEQLNLWIRRCFNDLGMLVTETREGPYPYAGVPWYSTPFGRDGIITALELLWCNPRLARGVLQFLAATQADAVELGRDAEPGKMVHELRRGEMADLGEIPFGRYYGSVDATPLFIMLADAYDAATADRAFTEQLWPHVERALSWIDQYGDRDHDGFVEYLRSSEAGLLQQGWKDSHDSVFHADGSAATGPIALCEVQGYVYAALVGAARLALALGLEDRARELRVRAETLRERFDQAFWCPELSTYALALDGDKRPCRVRTSNAGHCLFTGIALPERAQRIAEQMFSASMWSGWGIRTLSADEVRYNPMSYHNGSVWPHDNAIIAAGCARYRLKQPACEVLSSLFDASMFFELKRLPELFCGFARRIGEGPTQYPVACMPQAWAAGAPFLLLRAALGMTVDASAGRLTFDRPSLPACIEELRLRNLRVGQAIVDLRLHRYADNVGINVERRLGHVEVITIK